MALERLGDLSPTPIRAGSAILRSLKGMSVEAPHPSLPATAPAVPAAGGAPGPGEAFDPRRHPPRVLYLSLPASDICNYRCRHCHIWLQEARPDPLSRRRRQELVEEFARLSPGGTVVLTGGEVTLDPEELFAIAAVCRAERLPLVTLTNGSRVQTPEAARALVESGLTQIVVSLDGHRPELHNYTRGVATAFEETTRAVRLLAAARDAWAPAVDVTVTAVVFRENLAELGEFVDFCRGLGADHVDFQMLARTFANRSPGRDVFFDKHFWRGDEEVAAARRQLSGFFARFGDDPFVVKGPADLPWILAYVGDPDFRSERPVCGSHQSNLHVDAEGNVALCFNTAAILAAPYVGSARDRSLAELWKGEKAGHDREVMDACTLNCGALNCHRRRFATA